RGGTGGAPRTRRNPVGNPGPPPPPQAPPLLGALARRRAVQATVRSRRWRRIRPVSSDPERQVWSTGTVQETGEAGPVMPYEEKREDRDDQRKTDPFSIDEKMEHYNVYNDRTEQCKSKRDADPGQEQ